MVLDAAEARRVSSIRAELVREHPYWGHLLLTSRLIQSESLPALAATDCHRTIWYAPHLTRHLTRGELTFVLLHEVGHQVLESEARRRGRAWRRWNAACDYAINRVVVAIRRPGTAEPAYPMPNGEHPILGPMRPLYDPAYAGLTAEAIYRSLSSAPEPTMFELSVSLPGETETCPATGHEGGLDLHLAASAAADDVSASGARLERARRSGEATGREPRRPIDGPERRRPLRTLLAPRADSAEYSLARPARRALADGFIAPGPAPGMEPDLVIALDTSASMSDAQLGAVRAAALSLIPMCRRLTVIVADARVHDAAEGAAGVALLRRRRWPGGGGTDHRPVFAWLAAAGRRPDQFVALTDLKTRLPERPPPFPVCWLVPGPVESAPLWGRVRCLAGPTDGHDGGTVSADSGER